MNSNLLSPYFRWSILLGLVLVLATNAGVARANAIVIDSQATFPVEMQLMVRGAAGGPGEMVQLSGNLHSVSHVTLDEHGGFHLVLQANPQGISGLGTDSGSVYRGTGATHITMNGQVGFEYTGTNTVQLIGQGKAVNFRLHENFHLTVHADGTVTSYHDHFRIEP